MSRIPIRVRLALAFALAMAVVLAAVGAFLYLRVGDSLAEQLDDSLVVRAETLAALVRQSDGSLSDSSLASADDEGFAQVLAPGGAVLASSPSLPRASLLSGEERARGASDSFFLRVEDVPGFDGEPLRVLVTPADGRGRPVVIATGASLEDVEDAREELLAQLLIVIPVALLLTALGGYLLAAAALRPVEAMRRQATEVSSERPGQRLPLPDARDEIYRLGETLNAMLGRLEAGLARERRFVADASHELRTPLSLLKAELELALRRERSPEEQERALRSVAEEVDRLTSLAEDLLVLARADESGLPLSPAPLAADELLDSLVRRFAQRAEDAGRALSVRKRGQRLVADRVRLEQALGNLVDNALRHGAGNVQLGADPEGDQVVFRVSDEGDGFPPDFLPHAFERFTRADESRSSGAAGLGLALVDAVARAHGGRVEAQNGSRGGATVSLSVPAVTAA